MKTSAKTVTEYYNLIPQERSQKLKSIHKLINKLFPDVKISLKFTMPTFERGEKYMALGNQKNYYCVYGCEGDNIKSYLKKHPNVKHGKSCINFSDKDTLALDDLAKVIKKALG